MKAISLIDNFGPCLQCKQGPKLSIKMIASTNIKQFYLIGSVLVKLQQICYFTNDFQSINFVSNTVKHILETSTIC